MTKTQELSWEPRRRGDIYCAPACGGKCKWSAYEAAVKAASKLAERLGDGWEPRVNENLGWHWSVVSAGGFMNVHKNKGLPGYHTLFSPDDGPGGRPGWSGQGLTPEAAVQDSKDAAMREILALSRVLEVTIHGLDGKPIPVHDED